MVTWTQMYMPMGGLGLSALVALIPIIFFFVALAVLRLKGHVAGAITLILSIRKYIPGCDSLLFHVSVHI